ncbi:MAG: HAMP domain-containing sensor histidine kinase [Lachnospiraceae bacterium]|nr:HAMP domain-containing sensor histidine kinase [Lachnospiraceae bacterium]
MKLSWKLFFITTPIFIIFLTVFGTWMVQDNFWSSFDREVEACMVENQMFQNSYELTKHALSETQREQASTKKIVESFYRRRGKADGNARVLGTHWEVLYQDNDLNIEHSIMEQLDDSHNVGYEIKRSGDEVYVVVLCRNVFGEYIETTKNITEVFENRTEMYSRYRMGVLLMAVLVGGVILLVLFFVMRNMQKLSRATRQFARGKYDTRVAIRSNDEIGTLAADFNWMANAMNTQMEQLQNEVQRQEEFTAAFAHELKTPLTSIIGYADTIRQMDLSPEETDMCADYIYRQGKRLQSLSYKLMEMTLAEKQEISYQEIYVPEFLQEIQRVVAVSLQEKNLRLSVSAQEGVIYGDRELLASVFINLIDNARKASEEGKNIWMTGVAMPGGYSVTVEDEGRGISPEELSRITEPFYMVDKSRARKEGGAGLGLALCRKIIELHQGSWQFQSEPGKGLKITVLFGLPEVTGRERTRRRREQRRAEKERKKGRRRQRNTER